MMENMRTTTNHTSSIGIGAKLKAARQAMQLSEKDAAARLHLNPRIILSLENEEFQGEIPVTFLKGYLRSYARILNLNEADLAGALDSLGTVASSPKPATALLSKPISRNNDRYIRWITYLIAFILIALVASWWSAHTKDNETAQTVIPASESTNNATTAPSGTANGTGSNVVPENAATDTPSKDITPPVPNAPAVHNSVMPIPVPPTTSVHPKTAPLHTNSNVPMGEPANPGVSDHNPVGKPVPGNVLPGVAEDGSIVNSAGPPVEVDLDHPTDNELNNPEDQRRMISTEPGLNTEDY